MTITEQQKSRKKRKGRNLQDVELLGVIKVSPKIVE